MKAFLYTLVLAGVLVGLVAVLQRSQVPGPKRLVRVSREPIASGPALPVSALDEKELEALNMAELFATGVEFMEQWHLPEAKAVFEKIAEDTLTAGVFVRLAECYGDPLFYDESRLRGLLARAGELAGADTLAAAGLRALFLGGDYEDAAALFAGALSRGTDDIELEYLRARALMKARDLSGTREAIERVLAVDESHGRARELLIELTTYAGDIEGAEELARDLAALYPGEPYPYVLLSYLETMLGNIEEAEDFCNNALNLDPRYPPAILARGYIYAARGGYDAAKVSFEKLLLFGEPSLSSTAREAMAYVDFLRGRFDDAVADMDEAVRIAFGYGAGVRAMSYLYRLVDYLCELGQGDEAESVIERWSTELDPFAKRLATLRLNIFRGNLESARSEFLEIEQRREFKPWMRLLGIEYRELVGLVYIKEKRYDKAMALLSGKGDATSRFDFLLGYASFQKGNAEDAFSYFAREYERRSTLTFPYHDDPILDVQSLFYLAESYVAVGDTEKARKYYEEFLSMWGDAVWKLQAVERAREKSVALSSDS